MYIWSWHCACACNAYSSMSVQRSRARPGYPRRMASAQGGPMQQASILRNLLGSINALCIPQSNWSSNFKIGFKVLRYRSKYRNITKFVCSMFVFEKLDDCFKIELTRTGTDGISYSFYSPNNVEIVIFKMFSKKEEEFWSYRDCIYIYIYIMSLYSYVHHVGCIRTLVLLFYAS